MPVLFLFKDKENCTGNTGALFAKLIETKFI